MPKMLVPLAVRRGIVYWLVNQIAGLEDGARSLSTAGHSG